jgi:hypothetical protein
MAHSFALFLAELTGHGGVAGQGQEFTQMAKTMRTTKRGRKAATTRRKTARKSTRSRKSTN